MGAVMKWVAQDTTPEFGSLIRSGDYWIRHYIVPQALGFGISAARAYHNAVQIGEYTGVNALRDAQERCERHAAYVPELHFAARQGGER
jgi:hypothetical protein